MTFSAVRRLGVLAAALLLVVGGAPTLSAQTGSLQGRVVDSTGAAVVGALITVDGSGQRTVSISRGRYSLGGVQSGQRKLLVRAIGFVPDSFTVTVAPVRSSTSFLS